MTVSYLFSPSTRGFYIEGLHPVIPEDCLHVSSEQHSALMAAQSTGMQITCTDGAVVAVPPAPPSAELLATIKRGERNDLLAASDWIVLRHRDEVEMELVPTLSVEQHAELLLYRQALRDITGEAGFPAVEFPEPPAIDGLG